MTLPEFYPFSWQHALKGDIKNASKMSFSGPYFHVFGLNTKIYSVSFHIQSECEKMRSRKTPNTDSFHAATVANTFTYDHILPLILICKKAKDFT